MRWPTPAPTPTLIVTSIATTAPTPHGGGALPANDADTSTPPQRDSRRWFLISAASGLVSACGGGGSASTPPPPPGPPLLPALPEVPVDGPAWLTFGGDAQ